AKLTVAQNVERRVPEAAGRKDGDGGQGVVALCLERSVLTEAEFGHLPLAMGHEAAEHLGRGHREEVELEARCLNSPRSEVPYVVVLLQRHCQGEFVSHSSCSSRKRSGWGQPAWPKVLARSHGAGSNLGHARSDDP